LLAADARQVVAAGNSIAIVTDSTMGVTALSVRDARTGAEIVRRDGIDARPIAFNGRYVAFREKDDIQLIDLETRRESAPWPAARGAAFDALCMTPALLMAAARDNERLALVTAPLDDPDAATTTTLPVSADDVETVEILCSASNALVVLDAGRTAFLWRAPDAVEAFELDGRMAVAVTDDFVYALAGAAVTRHPIAGAASWESIYTTTARLAPRVLVSEEALVRCIQINESGRSDLVSISTLDGSTTIQPLPPDRPWDQLSRWTMTNERLVAVGRRDARAWLFAIALPAALPAAPLPPPATRDVAALPTDGDAEQRALAWLDRQLAPPFRTRSGADGRLIDSYEDSKRVGWTYDAAVAAIAFTAWGRIEQARQLLAGLDHIQNDDGSWEFAYEPDGALSLEGKRYIGAMAWVVIAANFFESDTGDRTFERMADAALRFIDGFIVHDPESSLDGGVSMGPAAPQVFSTEHNADAMSAFLWRGRLSGRQEYLDTATRLRAFLFRALSVESPDRQQFYFKVGARDTTVYLDAQTWTTLALAPSDRSDERFVRALAVAESRLRVVNGRLGPVEHIIGFRDAEDSSTNKVWTEGTEGMVAARLALGDEDAARDYHQQTARLQTPTGGIPYATANGDGWSTDPAVAGTAWFLLNEVSPPRNPFAPAIVR
jgi:hypothetical protein